MSGNFKISLYLGTNNSGSNLKKNVYEKELRDINTKYPLSSNQIDIHKTYLSKNDQGLEVGFFIRNGASKSISLEKINLAILDNSNNVIVANNFNFKEFGFIPAFSARPFTVNFPCEDEINLRKNEEYRLQFSLENMHADKTVGIQLEDLPLDIDFEEEILMKDFISSLEALPPGKVMSNLYKLSYTDEGAMSCILLFRNSTDGDFTLNTLSITIVSEENIVVAQKNFNGENFNISVGARKSKFIELFIEPTNVLGSHYDLSKCKIAFQ